MTPSHSKTLSEHARYQYHIKHLKHYTGNCGSLWQKVRNTYFGILKQGSAQCKKRNFYQSSETEIFL